MTTDDSILIVSIFVKIVNYAEKHLALHVATDIITSIILLLVKIFGYGSE